MGRVPVLFKAARTKLFMGLNRLSQVGSTVYLAGEKLTVKLDTYINRHALTVHQNTPFRYVMLRVLGLGSGC